MSSNNRVKFKNGTKDKRAEDFISIINAIIPGKKEINVSGVNALCASLKVLDLLAIAMHNPLIKKEYEIITTIENIRLPKDSIKFVPS